ncbi:MAG TPA: hypothetical protein VN436_13930 [Holophaga sp.]|nr:hypothetical protein [Holophaga sp.]
MSSETNTLFTAGVMAKDLGVTDAKVKKAIKELNLEPAAKKGCCCYYTGEDLARIKAALK